MSPPSQAQTTLVTLWASLLASQFVFIVVLFVVGTPANDPNPILPILMAIAAVPLALASLVAPKVVFQNAVRSAAIPTVEVPDPDGLPGFGKTVRVAKDPKAAVRALLGPYTTRVILSCALAEAVSICGFVARFLGSDWPVVVPFFVVGIALCALQFPSQSKLVRDAEAALGARLEAA